MNTSLTVKEMIESLTIKNDLSMEKIAGEIGVSSLSVSRWKKGETTPKSRIIVKALENYFHSICTN